MAQRVRGGPAASCPLDATACDPNARMPLLRRWLPPQDTRTVGGPDASGQIPSGDPPPFIEADIEIEGGAVGIGDFFGGIAVEEAVYEWGFFVRFAPDAAVRIRTVTFAADADLSEAYLRTLELEGPHYVPAGTYSVLDRKLTIPVLRRR